MPSSPEKALAYVKGEPPSRGSRSLQSQPHDVLGHVHVHPFPKRARRLPHGEPATCPQSAVQRAAVIT